MSPKFWLRCEKCGTQVLTFSVTEDAYSRRYIITAWCHEKREVLIVSDKDLLEKKNDSFSLFTKKPIGPFKVGDRVKWKEGLNNTTNGVVAGKTLTGEVVVDWLSKLWLDIPDVSIGMHDPESLEFAETPIERMKRRYEESVDSG